MNRQQKYNAAVRRAAATPAPGPLAAALFTPPRRVAGLELRPFVNSDVLLMQKLNSALLVLCMESTQEGADKKDLEFPNESALEVAYILLHTPAECRELLRRGADALREAAIVELADTNRVNPADLADLKQGLVLHLADAMKTWMAHRAPSTPGETFTQPPGAPTTASDGSSTSSAG